MRTTSKSAEETRELIYLALQDHGDWTTSAQLSEELGIDRDTIKNSFRKLKQEHPNIISSRQFGYKIVAERKNSEGYSDPTAQAAVDSVDAELTTKNGVVNKSISKKEYNHSFYGADYDDILPGTLWETSSSNGNTDFFFVISNMVNGAPIAFGLNVYPQDEDGYSDRKTDVVIDSVVSGVYIGDVSCLRSKPMKYFMGEVTIMRPSETLSMVKSAISKLLGFDESLKLEYEAGYQIGLSDGKSAAEEHQRGLREGTDKGYDKGYKDGYDTCKKEVEDERKAQTILDDDISKIEPETVDYADVVQLITERNLYKNFYEQLLEVMKA